MRNLSNQFSNESNFIKKKKIVKKVKRQELTKYTHRSKEILNALKNHVMISSDFWQWYSTHLNHSSVLPPVSWPWRPSSVSGYAWVAPRGSPASPRGCGRGQTWRNNHWGQSTHRHCQCWLPSCDADDKQVRVFSDREKGGTMKILYVILSN